MRSVAMMSIHEEEPEASECQACGELRQTLRFCLGALSRYYGEELARNDPRETAASDLIQGGIVFRAEKALRTPCTCGRSDA